MTTKEKYTRQMNNISFCADFEAETVQLLREAAQRKESLSMKNKKTFKILIAAAVFALLMTTTAFAVSALLSPKDVAQQLGYDDVSKAFESGDAVLIDESVTLGDYNVTLLGITSGEQLEFIDDAPVEAQRSYVVVSIERCDGTPMDPLDGSPFTFSPFIQGQLPWMVNAWSLECAANGLFVDGKAYYLFNYSTLEIFADRTVYLAAYEGFSPGSEDFMMAEDGSIHFTDALEGEKHMFTLPLDPSRANPEAVEQFLAVHGIVSPEEVFGEETSESAQPEQTTNFEEDFAYTPTTATAE